jgi:hypothetical protein
MFSIRPKRDQGGSIINIGGHEDNRNYEARDNSPIIIGDTMAPLGDTWLRFAGKQAGRVLEGTTDILTSPAKWLAHMQDYW